MVDPPWGIPQSSLWGIPALAGSADEGVSFFYRHPHPLCVEKLVFEPQSLRRFW